MLLFSHLRGYLPQHSNIPIFHHSIIPIFHSSNSFVVIIQLGDNRSIVSTFIFLLNPSTILHHRIIPLSLHNHPLLSPLFHYSTIPFLHTSNSFVVIIQLGDNRSIVSTFIFLLPFNDQRSSINDHNSSFHPLPSPRYNPRCARLTRGPVGAPLLFIVQHSTFNDQRSSFNVPPFFYFKSDHYHIIDLLHISFPCLEGFVKDLLLLRHRQGADPYQ